VVGRYIQTLIGPKSSN